jgi:hypothetical protein
VLQGFSSLAAASDVSSQWPVVSKKKQNQGRGPVFAGH